jgi:hypothetical protein
MNVVLSFCDTKSPRTPAIKLKERNPAVSSLIYFDKELQLSYSNNKN